MEIGSAKLTSPNKRLARTDSTFFFFFCSIHKLISDHHFNQKACVLVCWLLKISKQNFVVIKSYTKPGMNIGSGPH